MTVTSHECGITLTKLPAASAVCDGATVTYSYAVTNNSDEFTWTGTLVDSVLGPVGTDPIVLGPGETLTFEADGPITGTVENTAPRPAPSTTPMPPRSARASTRPSRARTAASR